MSESPTLVEMGYLKAPHGVKGAIKVHLYNPHQESLLFQATASKPVSVFIDAKKIWLSLERLNFSNNENAIAIFTEIKSIDEAKALLPSSFSIERESLGFEDCYVIDLCGLTVLTTEGKVWGKVESTYSNGAQEVLVLVSDEDPSLHIELPYVDVFFPQVDLEKGEIICHFPEEI
jgi:16S rRNA processing protein RimM